MINILQVKPYIDYVSTSTPKAVQDNIKSSILLIDSMLNPNSQLHLELHKILNSLHKNLKIDFKKISQVDKKKSIEWFDFSSRYDLVIIFVGDCATCTFKASQDIKELNDKNVLTFLITFSEMKSLIDQYTIKKYPEKLFYFDEENFIDKLQKEFS